MLSRTWPVVPVPWSIGKWQRLQPLLEDHCLRLDKLAWLLLWADSVLLGARWDS
jgi:hypothetical protein